MENNLAACGCGGHPILDNAHNMNTQDYKYAIRVKCTKCHISTSTATTNSQEKLAELKGILSAEWNRAMSRPTPVITDELLLKMAIAFNGIYCRQADDEKDITPCLRAALTAALPHAVDAGAVYNQAVEIKGNVFGDKGLNGLARQVRDKVISKWDDYESPDHPYGYSESVRLQATKSIIRNALEAVYQAGVNVALKNPTATAMPDAKAIRKEVGFPLLWICQASSAPALEWMGDGWSATLHIEGSRFCVVGYSAREKNFLERYTDPDEAMKAIRALAAGKGV